TSIHIFAHRLVVRESVEGYLGSACAYIMSIIIYTYIIIPNKIPEFFFTMMSQEIGTMHFIINSSSNTSPKYISIPSQIVIIFVPIFTLVNKDTGLCIGPVNHFFQKSGD